MQLDPNITLATLLAAIPSAAAACESLNIGIEGNLDKSLEQLCSEAGVTLTTFFDTLDSLDWDQECRPD